ncbi:MAG: response regulator [Caldilineaceae bacterium]|nr:response regulator [Caldilineaceae bacterium]
MSQLSHDILLIDDDTVDAELVQRLLPLPYQVRLAATGQSGRTMVQCRRPDCVLLDYRLPDMDGLQLLPILTAQGIPVIVLTGEERPTVIVQAMQQGAQDYLVKQNLTAFGLEYAITRAIEKMALQQNLAAKNQQLQQLASALTLAEQQERQRLAQILHDDLQQRLYGIQLRLLSIKEAAEVVPPLVVQAQEAYTWIGDAIRITRQLTVDLSPPILKEEGLTDALEWLVTYMAEVQGLKVTIQAAHSFYIANEQMRLLLFQLVREMLFNVVKHAGTDRALVTLQETAAKELQISVSDEGWGFDVARTMATNPGSFGLFSIGDRLALFGGRLEITSAPAQGTQITLTLPFPS